MFFHSLTCWLCIAWGLNSNLCLKTMICIITQIVKRDEYEKWPKGCCNIYVYIFFSQGAFDKDWSKKLQCQFSIFSLSLQGSVFAVCPCLWNSSVIDLHQLQSAQRERKLSYIYIWKWQRKKSFSTFVLKIYVNFITNAYSPKEKGQCI